MTSRFACAVRYSPTSPLRSSKRAPKSTSRPDRHEGGSSRSSATTARPACGGGRGAGRGGHAPSQLAPRRLRSSMACCARRRSWSRSPCASRGGTARRTISRLCLDRLRAPARRPNRRRAPPRPGQRRSRREKRHPLMRRRRSACRRTKARAHHLVPRPHGYGASPRVRTRRSALEAWRSWDLAPAWPPNCLALGCFN